MSMPVKPGALVVFSGGQDSTTCLFQALRDHGGPENVACITFAYGQRHGREVEVARAIVDDLGIRTHKIVVTDWFGAVTTNALLDHDRPIETEPGAGCPTTCVDGRNAFFLLAAAVYAKQLGMREIVTGVCQTDFSGYPDCRDVFVKAMNRALDLAMDTSFAIRTPLMFLDKAQTWALADELGALDYIEKRTLTCYNGIVGLGCGTCPACGLRAAGLAAYRNRRAAAHGDFS